MQIQQLQVSYDAREDRLVLRIATSAREEILVALTRRLVKALWPYLQKMLATHLKGDATPEPIVVGEDIDGEPLTPELDAGSFSEPYDEADLSHPLGPEPVLAMESRLKPLDDAVCRITLGETRARTVSFDCDRDLMQALCAMIRATVAKAEWNLDLDALLVAESAAAAPESSSTLH